MSAKQAAWGLDTIVMVRPARWWRIKSTVICGLSQGRSYAALGYVIDWGATVRAGQFDQGANG